MLVNVGIKIYISLKSAVSAVLKEFSKTLYKKTYISKRSFKKGGQYLSTMLFGLHAVTVHIFSCESNNVGKCWTKTYIGKNVGNCWHKNYI